MTPEEKKVVLRSKAKDFLIEKGYDRADEIAPNIVLPDLLAEFALQQLPDAPETQEEHFIELVKIANNIP